MLNKVIILLLILILSACQDEEDTTTLYSYTYSIGDSVRVRTGEGVKVGDRIYFYPTSLDDPPYTGIAVLVNDEFLSLYDNRAGFFFDDFEENFTVSEIGQATGGNVSFSYYDDISGCNVNGNLSGFVLSVSVRDCERAGEMDGSGHIVDGVLLGAATNYNYAIYINYQF